MMHNPHASRILPTRPSLTVDHGAAAEAEGSLGAGATVVMSWMLAC